MALQKVQHTNQSILDKCRDLGRKPRAQSPTAMLEQTKERIHNISQDRHILNRSCGEELVRSSLTRARRSAPKKRRRTQRKRMRPVKQVCSDTIEKTISSTDEAVAQRKRARSHKGSPPCPIIHTMIDTSLHLHIPTFHSHNSSSHRTVHHERGTVSWSVLRSLQLLTDDNHEPGQPSSARALLNNLGHGGYAGIRVREAENPGPATHGRDWTVTEQPNATHKRINEAGDSAPSGQDSATWGVENLRTWGSLAAPKVLPAPPPSTMRNSRRPPQPKQQHSEHLRCAQCGPDPAARNAPTEVQLIWQKHGGQLLLPDSVGRRLDRAACVVCGTIRSQRYNRCGFCNSNTRLRELRALLRARSQCTIWDIVFTERDKHLLAELRRASAMALPRCVVSRYATAWAESLERAMSGHQP